MDGRREWRTVILLLDMCSPESQDMGKNFTLGREKWEVWPLLGVRRSDEEYEKRPKFNQ